MHDHVSGFEELETLARFLGEIAQRLNSAGRDMSDLVLQVEHRNRELAILHEIAATVSRSLDLHEVLDGALERIMALLHLDAGVVYLRTGDAADYTLASCRGLPAEIEQRMAAPAEQDELSHAVSTFTAIVANADRTDTRSLEATPYWDIGLRIAVAIPLRAKEITRGVLIAAAREERPFSDDDLRLLDGVARHLAVAVENARLYEESGRLAAVEERNRLAREIHDTIAQSLAGLVIHLEAAGRTLAREPERAAASLSAAKEMARAALAEARRSVWNLRPVALDECGLAKALAEEAQRVFPGDSGVRTEVVVTGEAAELAPDVAANLLRIAQEALHNVCSHAQADDVQVVLAYTPERVRLTVTDDGRGMQTPADQLATGSGFGLISMRERARGIGGELRLLSVPGVGTSVDVVVPLRTTLADQHEGAPT